jgi:hypothetical protein
VQGMGDRSYVCKSTYPAHELLVVVLHCRAEVNVSFESLVHILGCSTVL